jgi:hypothetical protein
MTCVLGFFAIYEVCTVAPKQWFDTMTQGKAWHPVVVQAAQLQASAK